MCVFLCVGRVVSVSRPQNTLFHQHDIQNAFGRGSVWTVDLSGRRTENGRRKAQGEGRRKKTKRILFH